jgi:hypothetical protein
MKKKSLAYDAIYDNNNKFIPGYYMLCFNAMCFEKVPSISMNFCSILIPFIVQYKQCVHRHVYNFFLVVQVKLEFLCTSSVCRNRF